jgi:Putative abortive phage resistance protein AbiGi, antitoxin
MRIDEILARRSDLSAFLVHLSRNSNALTAKERLKSIIHDQKIKAMTAFGHAVQALNNNNNISSESQRCVSFTETPLEHVSLLLEQIEGRNCNFEPYGIAITKRQGRKAGVNPVWYVDLTPGHDWLSNAINEAVQAVIVSGTFDQSPISKLTPFIEQMGSGTGLTGGHYRKEFWWEREWRYVGNLTLPAKIIVLCPRADFAEIEVIVNENEFPLRAKFIDPTWSLEQIIAHLAEFDEDDISVF